MISRRVSRRRQGGQVLPIVALLATVLFGLAALAIDGSHGHEIQLQSQYTADSASVSAAKIWATENPSGPPAYTNASPDQAVLTAERIPYLEGVHTDGAHACITTSGSQTDVVYYDVTPVNGCAAAAAPPAGWGQKVEVTIPPIPLVTGCTYACLRVTVTQLIPTYLAGTIGRASLTVVGSGVAAIGTSAVLPCVLCTLATTGVSVNLSGSPSLIARNGAILVDSSNAAAITVTGGSSVTATGVAASVEIVGGESCSAGTTCTAPHTGFAPVSDPYGGVPYPSVGGASNGAFSCTGSSTCAITPGVYTTFNADNSGHVNMGAGTYVFTGAVSIGGAAVVSSNGLAVTLYLTCAGYDTSHLSPCAAGQTPQTTCTGSSGFNTVGSGAVTLKPPTSGVYQGMSLFYDRNNPAPVCMSGATAPSLGGSMYAADGNLIISGSSATNSVTVVNGVTLTGASSLTLDASAGGGGVGAPANLGGVGVPTIVG